MSGLVKVIGERLVSDNTRVSKARSHWPLFRARTREYVSRWLVGGENGPARSLQGDYGRDQTAPKYSHFLVPSLIEPFAVLLRLSSSASVVLLTFSRTINDADVFR